MSGVRRQQLAKRYAGDKIPIIHVAQQKGRYTGAKDCSDWRDSNMKYGRDPFQTTDGAYPNTGKPISAEEPARGEHED